MKVCIYDYKVSDLHLDLTLVSMSTKSHPHRLMLTSNVEMMNTEREEERRNVCDLTPGT